MYTQEQFHKNMAMNNNYIQMDIRDECRDAIWQAEEDEKAIQLAQALRDIRDNVWDTYERDMEIYALMHELQGAWCCMWDDNELTEELVHLYRNKRALFARLYEGVYTTLHPDDMERYVKG